MNTIKRNSETKDATPWNIKLVGWLVIIVVLLVVIELAGYFAWSYLKNNERQGGVWKVQQIIGESSKNSKGTIVSHPYSLYWNNPNFKDEFGSQYNSLGHRNKYESQTKVDFKILVLGGSTTNEYPYVKDPTKIWTAVLEKKLKDEFPTHSIAVINAGAAYATSAELLSHYVFIGMDLKPDMVIFHEGGNDIVPLLFENYKSDYSHFRKSTASGDGRPFEKALLTHSYTARVFYAYWLRKEGVYDSRSFAQIDKVAASKRVHESSSPAFTRNVENIIRLALSEKSQVLLVGFLQAERSQLAKNNPAFIGLEDALIEGVKKHDSIMTELAKSYSIQFLKLDQNKFSPSWFLDNCHLKEEGDEEKANQILLLVRQLINVRTGGKL
jgi:lysophospholipase L1-like esterase